MATPFVLDMPESDVRAAFARVVASHAFAASARHREILRYLMERALNGRVGALRETMLARELFAPGGTKYDSAADPIARVAITRLHAQPKHYCVTAAPDDPGVIPVPPDGHVPWSDRRADAPPLDVGPPTVDPSAFEPVAVAAPAPTSAPAPRPFGLPGVAPAMIVAVVALAVSAWALWRTNEPRGPATVAVIPYVAPAEDRALAQTGEIVSAFMNVALSRMPDVHVVATASVVDAMRRTHDALEAGRTL